jgi:acyl-CoA thioesterase I
VTGIRRLPAVPLAAAALWAAALSAAPAAAQTLYVAFGDSITQGVGDDPSRAEPGWPPRLEEILADRGEDAVVVNAGLAGETTSEGLERIRSVLNQHGGDVLLLMEGTNDVGSRISEETSLFNLDTIAERAEARGLSVIHATIVPRLPSANYDGNNRVTAGFNAKVRELAWQNERGLADPFEVFRYQTPDWESLYAGGADKLHPNAAGYDRLAEVFADVITGVDSVPPVTGLVSPRDDEQRVPPNTVVRVDLYDFGAGIDLGATRLLINGQEVDTPLTGSPSKVEIRYQPPVPFQGVVFIGLRGRDTASPPNVIDRTLAQFVTAGTVFLKGDIDRDGRVDGADLVALALRFGSREGDFRYRRFADLDEDGRVDGRDLAILAGNFGKNST